MKFLFAFQNNYMNNMNSTVGKQNIEGLCRHVKV